MWQYIPTEELYHHGILGQKWGVRRYQNPDGTLTAKGRKRLAKNELEIETAKAKVSYDKAKAKGTVDDTKKIKYNLKIAEARQKYRKEIADINKSVAEEKKLKEAEKFSNQKPEKQHVARNFITSVALTVGATLIVKKLSDKAGELFTDKMRRQSRYDKLKELKEKREKNKEEAKKKAEEAKKKAEEKADERAVAADDRARERERNKQKRILDSELKSVTRKKENLDNRVEQLKLSKYFNNLSGRKSPLQEKVRNVQNSTLSKFVSEGEEYAKQISELKSLLSNYM